MNVSVIIPCLNEEKYIAQCIDSILNSDYSQEQVEIIIVDGLSNDKTTNIIDTYLEKYTFIKLIENRNRTTQWALNMGIKQASGEIIIILGAHAALSKNYISECVKLLKNDQNIVCVGGVIENIYENETSKIIGYAMSSSFGVGNAYFRTGTKSGFVDTVGFGAYKKEIFEKIGYFDEELVRNQDDELNFRVTKNGYKIYLDTGLKLLYYTRASFKKLFHQYFQYGYWKVYVNKKHKTITTLRQIVPSLFVGFFVIGFFLSFFNKYLFSAYLITLFIYIVLAQLNAVKKVKTMKDTILFIFTCFILHISYGSGYIYGILTFLLLQKKPSDFSKEVTR